ncbi:Protein required for ethanol metabolism [Geranomyces variabilis]|nr:Protein required for ethanol metabolism [Geranomyces variabilis]
MASLARWYHGHLTSRPVFTQAVSTGVLFAAGDGIAQHAVEKRSVGDHDWARTGRLSAYGLFALGPALSLWYRFLSRAVTIKNPLGSTVARAAIDQTVFAPTNTVCFFTSQGLMEGKSLEQVKTKLRDSFWPTYKANCIVWPPIQMVNFYFTPVNYQSLVVNTVALFWNSYLSMANAKK